MYVPFMILHVYICIYIWILLHFVILYGGIICTIGMYYMYNGSVWYLCGNRTLYSRRESNKDLSRKNY